MFIVNAGKDLDLVARIFAAGGRASRDFLILSYNLVSKAKEVLIAAAFRFVVSPRPTPCKIHQSCRDACRMSAF